jgi:hypothetical protein
MDRFCKSLRCLESMSLAYNFFSMRADITDIPGYWDSIIDSAPDNSPTSKRELIHMKRNFHNPPNRRWFGGFSEWLNRLNTVTSSNSISRNFHWSDKYIIYHAAASNLLGSRSHCSLTRSQESCPNFQSSLDISVTGVAQANSQFGYACASTAHSSMLMLFAATISRQALSPFIDR